MVFKFEGLEPAVIRVACEVFSRRCLVDRDMVLYSLCQQIAKHHEMVEELVDKSPQFLAELLRQKERYDRWAKCNKTK